MLLCPARLRLSLHDGDLRCELRLFFFWRVPLDKLAARRKKPTRDQSTRDKPARNQSVQDTTPTDAQSAPQSPAAEAPVRQKKSKAKKDKKSGYLDSLRPSSLSEGIFLVRAILDAAGKPLRFCCRSIRIRQLEIDLLVADEDAARCAVLYGTVNLLLYNALGWLSRRFSVKKVRRISVGCRYNSNAWRYDFACVISLSPLVAIGVVLGMAARFWLSTRNGLSPTPSAA